MTRASGCGRELNGQLPVGVEPQYRVVVFGESVAQHGV